MPMPAAAAANAYASLARLTDGVPSFAKRGLDDTATGDFGAMVKQAMNAIVDAGHKSDAQMRAAAAGKANIVDVVTAVSQTEVAVDALVSVRDRVIAAYEDILKMPI
jgi:flagellar hook-basal body complex protein FliE